MSLKIERIYAFVAVDPENGDEGIMAFQPPNQHVMLPMIGADLDRVKDLIPIADEMEERLGVPYRIKYFDEVPSESVLN